MKTEFDIAVIGSGFGGSLMAMIAQRLGRSVVLLEQGRHPRFAIGESSTPLANLLLEELANRYDLPRLLPLTKWGTWQREHPELAVGLKRGFTFYHHRFGESYVVDAERHRQLLVAASPHDGIADTHWFREEFDAFLVGEAQALGVSYHDKFELNEVSFGEAGGRLRGVREGRHFEYQARLVIDATGPRGALHRRLQLGERQLPGYPATQALFNHFRGVKRLDTVFNSSGEPPFPPDDAAVHHIFPGGWIWVLRFNNGITSAGAALDARLANELRVQEGKPAWERLLERLPAVREQFAGARECRAFIHQPQLAFASAEVHGPGWVMLPSAAGFVDPLLSTGFPLTLLGVRRLAHIIDKHWEPAERNSALATYASQTGRELNITASLISALYCRLDDPPLFNALTLLYFAAASYAESARRLNRADLAPGFLLCDKAGFGDALREITDLARRPLAAEQRAKLLASIGQVIAPVNVAGLGDPARRNWYPARAEDLLASARLLEASSVDIQRLLVASGFFTAPARK